MKWYIENNDGTTTPVPCEEYAAWSTENPGRRRIAKDELPWGGWVSTIFLGLDHRYFGDGPPLLYETMVFPARDDLGEIDCRRYETREQALAGHAELYREWEHHEPAGKEKP